MVGKRNWLVVAANSDIAITAIVDRTAMRRIGVRARLIAVTPVLNLSGSSTWLKTAPEFTALLANRQNLRKPILSWVFHAPSARCQQMV
jgi:SUMO ligase MMS21 Smc5/6 complex component